MKRIINGLIKVALNHEEIKEVLEGITKIKHFIKIYDSEGINYSSVKDNWKRFEKNNRRIAVNVVYAKKEKNISCLCFKT